MCHHQHDHLDSQTNGSRPNLKLGWWDADAGKFVSSDVAVGRGSLSFRVHSSKQPMASAERRHAPAGRSVPDVILESGCGHYMYMSGVFDHARETSTLYEVEQDLVRGLLFSSANLQILTRPELMRNLSFADSE